jgi:hypothetical protein
VAALAEETDAWQLFAERFNVWQQCHKG